MSGGSERAEQLWQYCSLYEYGDKCEVVFRTATGPVTRQLSGSGAPYPVQNPFSKGMASLGACGWELVSVQHGMSVVVPHSTMGSSDEARSGYIRWDNRVAYFKRPVRAGRAVDEPKAQIK